MSSIVFKQSYKARADPSTAGLNVRHLQYIATRPGTVFNKGCAFGLWGHLPADRGIQIQTDLTLAKKVIRAVSKDHTLYRAIVSVGKEDAKAHGLYHREEWEKLVNTHIQTIAQEMQIKPENFCWCASMHCEMNHPHVHILYWDNGDQPRPDGIPKPLFAARAERIRAAFAGDLNKEQILETQKEQRQELKQLRTALQAMCMETNPEKALNLTKLYKSQHLEGMSKQIAELIQRMPAKGSLRYAYLPPSYKMLVDKFITQSLKLPELAKEAKQYEDLTQKISKLYANGEVGTAMNLEKARKKLYNALGNEIMAIIREAKDEILLSAPTEDWEAHNLLREAAGSLAPSLPSYQVLLSLLPRERIPVGCMYHQIPGFREQINQVLGDIMQDARVRLRLQSYALQKAGIDLSQKPDAPAWKPPSKETEAPNAPENEPVELEDQLDEKEREHRFRGKLLTSAEWEDYQASYKDVKKELRSEITAQLRQDAGWNEEALRSTAAMTLGNMMLLASQLVYQRQAMLQQAGLAKSRSRELSREAKKDRRATQSQGSEWGDLY